jgi:hypothetical protein
VNASEEFRSLVNGNSPLIFARHPRSPPSGASFLVLTELAICLRKITWKQRVSKKPADAAHLG